MLIWLEWLFFFWSISLLIIMIIWMITYFTFLIRNWRSVKTVQRTGTRLVSLKAICIYGPIKWHAIVDSFQIICLEFGIVRLNYIFISYINFRFYFKGFFLFYFSLFQLQTLYNLVFTFWSLKLWILKKNIFMNIWTLKFSPLLEIKVY
jgi:hypothetical protein